MPEKNRRLAATVVEAWRVIDLYLDQPLLEATPAEVAGMTGLAASTARTYLTTWESVGALRKNRDGEYVLGDTILKLSAKYRNALTRSFLEGDSRLEKITAQAERELDDRPRAGAMSVGEGDAKGGAQRSNEEVALRPPPHTTHRPIFAFLYPWPDNFNWRP